MEDEKKKSSKRFLIIYCLAIFVFAVALILITYVSQVKSAEATDALKDQLSDTKNQLSTSEMTREQLENEVVTLKEANTSLTSEKEILTSEKDTVTTEKAELEKKLVASQKLTGLVNTKRTGTKKEFKAALDEFEAAGYPALLSPEDTEIYNSIK